MGNPLHDSMYNNPHEEVSPLVPNWDVEENDEAEPLDAGEDDNDGTD